MRSSLWLAVGVTGRRTRPEGIILGERRSPSGIPKRSKYSRLVRLSRALLVAIQWETESTFNCTFFELCAFRISI